MTFIDRVLSEHHDEFGLAAHGIGRAWATVLLTPRYVTSRHLVALVFAPGAGQPALVVKMPRQPGDNEGVRREAVMLRLLDGYSPGRRLGVPEVLGTVDVGEHTVLVESALTGPPLDPERVARDRAAAVRAGTEFVAALPATKQPADNRDWYQRTVVDPLRALVELATLGGEVAELAERTHVLLAPLRAVELPAVFEHADLSHPNLFCGPDGGLQVVDWERASTDGVPAHDLVFFLQYAAESAVAAYTRDAQLAAFDGVFGADGWGLPAVRAHLRARGVDPDLTSLLVLATWARSAATLAYRLAHEATGGSDPGRISAAVAEDRDFWLWRHAIRSCRFA